MPFSRRHSALAPLPMLICSMLLLASLAAQGQIQWVGGWQPALQAARQGNKPLFVYFYSNKANECFRFQRDTLTNADVVGYVNANFVGLAVDSTVVRDLTVQFGVFKVPSVLLLAPDGKEFARFVTYYPPAQLVESLKQSLSTSEQAAEPSASAQSLRQTYPNAIFHETFDSLTGWNNHSSSEGARANINLIRGVYGRAFAIQYALRTNEFNYIQIHKELDPRMHFPLPQQYTVILHLAGKGGANSFDLKFADDDGTNYGAMIPIPLDFKGRRILVTSNEIGYLWGGNDKVISKVKYFLIGISPLGDTWPKAPADVSGSLYIDELVIIPGIIKD